MGYTTEFKGKLTINKKLDKKTALEISKLNKSEHHNKSTKNTQKPDSRCKWILSKDNKHIIWNGEEKFYYYIEWLQFIINKILEPHSYTLSGELIAIGEDSKNDISKITVKNNKVIHKQFSKKEIMIFEENHEKETSKSAGHIIAKTKADCLPLPKWIFFNLHELFIKNIFSKKYYHNFVLVKEQDRSINLYDISDDELKKNEISNSSLDSHRKKKLNLPLSNITEIIHLNSPLHRWILKSNKVYCICRNDKNWPRKELYLVKNSEIITQLKEEITKINKDFLYHRSNDLHLAYFIIKKIIIALVMGFLTLAAFRSIYLSIIELIQNFSAKPLVIISITGLILYFINIKLLFKVFYYFFPMEIFRTKTAPNDVKE